MSAVSLNCGFSDVVWSKDWWKCSKCKRVMPPEYEHAVRCSSEELLQELFKRKPLQEQA